jgi:hypothetical protein
MDEQPGPYDDKHTRCAGDIVGVDHLETVADSQREPSEDAVAERRALRHLAEVELFSMRAPDRRVGAYELAARPAYTCERREGTDVHRTQDKRSHIRDAELLEG